MRRYAICVSLVAVAIAIIAGTVNAAISDQLRLADSLYTSLEYEAAVQVAKSAYNEMTREKPRDSMIVPCLERLAQYYYSAAQFNEAKQSLFELLAFLDSSDIYWPTARATTLSTIGELYYELGDYDSSSYFLDSAQTSWETIDSHESYEGYATCLNNVANLHADLGEFDKAEPLYLRSLELRIDLLGNEAADVAMSRSNLALVYHEQGRYDEAEPLYRQALEGWEAALGEDHPDIVPAVNNLAFLLSDMGRYSEAEPLYERAASLRLRALGQDNPRTALSLNNLALHYTDIGDLVAAGPIFEQALSAWEMSLGPDHHRIASVLNNLASLSIDLGRTDSAIVLYDRALKIRQASLGTDHPDVAIILLNLADAHAKIQSWMTAESLCVEALTIRKSSLGMNHPATALTLSNLAGILTERGKLDSAITLLRHSLSISREILGDEHPNIATALSTLGMTYARMNQPDSALTMMQQSVDMRIKVFGEFHPEVATAYESLSRIYRWRGDAQAGFDAAMKAFAIRRENLRAILPTLNNRDALRYSTFYQSSANHVISAYSDLQPATKVQDLAVTEVIIQSKGPVAEAIMLRDQVLRGLPEDSLLHEAESLRRARFQLSRLWVLGPGEDVEVYRRTLDSLADRIAGLEEQLARSVSNQVYVTHHPLSVSSVQERLAPGQSLVEYCRYRQLSAPFADSAIARYIAVVLSPENGIAIHQLNRAETVDHAVATYREIQQEYLENPIGLTAERRNQLRGTLEELYHLCWEPLIHDIPQSDLVLVAPDDQLHLVSFAALRHADRYLIEEVALQYLSAGRDLVRLAVVTERGSGMLAVGDPAFESIAEIEGVDTVPAAGLSRSVRSQCDMIEDMVLGQLPYTRREVRSVAKLFGSQTDEDVAVQLGGDATETNFRRSYRNRRVIHLATHGFFQPSWCDGLLDGYGAISVENPLLRSGLFFAGSRADIRQVSAVSDGVLTAAEVSDMDFRGTQWVVLSACESAVGDVVTGEGVYGLRRALQLSGARTIVGALFAVPDQATQEFMEVLYGESKADIPHTIRSYVLEQLASARAGNTDPLPGAWSAFVAVGDIKHFLSDDD